MSRAGDVYAFGIISEFHSPCFYVPALLLAMPLSPSVALSPSRLAAPVLPLYSFLASIQPFNDPLKVGPFPCSVGVPEPAWRGALP